MTPYGYFCLKGRLAMIKVTPQTNFRRRSLALLLTVVLTFGYAGLFAGLFAVRSEAAELTNVVIGVPETVYMTPQNNYNTATTSVKYYVNNTVNSSGGYSLDASNSATAGKFYVYSPQISTINSVSVNGATLSGLSASKSGSLFSDTDFTMALTSGISSSQSSLLEWTINVTDTSGVQHNLHAYTVAYAPYLSPVFAAGKTKNTRGSTDTWGSGMSWISGIHGISTAGGYYPYDNFLPLCGGPTAGNGTTSPDSWFNGNQQCGLPTKGGWYTTKEYGYNYGDETLCVFERSGEAYINVDTSRYNNMNQIPNLTCGVYMTDSENANTCWGYVGKLQNWDNRITSGREWHTRSTTNPSEYTAGVDYFAGDCWTNHGKNWWAKDVRMNMSIPSGWFAIRGAFGNDDAGDRCFCVLDCYLNVIQVNKSNLRNLIKSCYQYTNTIYPGDEYETFISAWRSAATVLGDPTRTDVTDVYNSLNSAKSKLHALTALSLNTEVVVNPTDGACRYYTFTPSDTGKYIFFTYDTDNTPDPYLYIYLPNISNLTGHETNALYSNDDIGDSKIRELLSGSQSNFGSWQSYIVTSNNLTAGTTYIVKAYNRHATGTYPLKVCKAVDITFDATGGATTFTKTLPAGHTLHMDQSGLTRDGHTLIAWSTDGQGAEAKTHMASQTITIPSSNTTYYALWYPTSPTALTLNGDHTATISAPSEIQYYTYTPSETRTYLIYSTSTATALDPFLLIYDDSTYHTQGTYQTYDDDGGNSHHDFVGAANRNFYKEIELEAGTKYLFGVKAYHNTTANSNLPTGSYPFRFEAVYKVEYDANGGSGAPAKQNKYYNRGLTLSSTVPTRTGYTFLGWSTSSSATTATYAAGGSYTANADAKLYSVWQINTSKLTVNPNGGTWSNSTSSQSFTQNYNTTKAIADPTRTGYNFTGWTLGGDKNGSFNSSTKVYTFGAGNNKTDTLTAEWSVIPYTITYNLDGGSVSGTNPASYNVETNTFTLTNPTKTGYAFKGWSGTGLTGDANQTVTIAKGSTGDRTYTANWTINKYTIVWKNYDGTVLETDNNVEHFSTPEYNGSTPTRAADGTNHYTFSGWNPEVSTVTGAATYTAQFTATAHTFTASEKIPATCTVMGTTTYTCSCGYSYDAQDIPALGHNYAWVADTANSHNAIHRCTRCDFSETVAVAANDSCLLDLGVGVMIDALKNDKEGAALAGVTADESVFKASVTNGQIAFVPQIILSSKVTFTYTVTYEGVTCAASVTVIPASSVYMEEKGFIEFKNSATAQWKDPDDAYTAAFENGDAPGDDASPVVFVPEYNGENSATYSMGTAKYVEVSKSNKGATATFTFKGTGFDLYSVTAGDTGAVLVTVNGATTTTKHNDETGEDETVPPVAKNLLVNTYFGYAYGPLFLTDNNVVTLAETTKPIYLLPQNSTEGFFIQGNRRGTTENTDGLERAYGWVANERGSETTDGGTLYQVPVISCTGMAYDTYTVTVEPKYSKMMDSANQGKYKFYVDSVRIYDPIDPTQISAGSDIYNAYVAAKEYDTHYQEVRDILIDAKTFDAAGDTTTAGVAFLETNKDANGNLVTDFATYKDIGPKNEVYLNPGQAIAFQVETGGNALPAKLAVGVKMVNGAGGSITVNNDTENEYNVTCATEMYKDILKAVTWANTTAGSYLTNVIVIRNSSASSVISLTKLKWSYGANETQSAAPARMLRFSFSRGALNTLELAQSTGETGAQTLDSSAVTVTWDKDTFELGETATLTITAPAIFEKALLDGKEIAGYEELDNGMRQWTYQVTAEELGAVSADVTLEDANGYRTKALSAPALAAQEPTVDLTEVTAVWENDAITLGETALLTATVPANIVSVTVGGEELTQFTLNEDGTKSFQYTVTPDAADAYQYTLTLAEGHGYTFDAGTTPLLTVEAPVVPETPDEPETPVTPDDPMNPDGPATDPAGESGDTSKGGRWSFYDLLQAIINFIRKVIGMFNINAQ